MKFAIVFLFALASAATFGQSITATKAYVDRKYTEVTNAVAFIVTNEVAGGFSPWTATVDIPENDWLDKSEKENFRNYTARWEISWVPKTPDEDHLDAYWSFYPLGNLEGKNDKWFIPPPDVEGLDENATNILFIIAAEREPPWRVVYVRTTRAKQKPGNALGLAMAKDLAKMDTSVKLHALTPEVTDTTVTLKPVDGTANWVGGKVEVLGGRLIGVSYSLIVKGFMQYYDPVASVDDNFVSTEYEATIELTDKNSTYTIEDYGDPGNPILEYIFTVTAPIDIKVDYGPTPKGPLEPGVRFACSQVHFNNGYCYINSSDWISQARFPSEYAGWEIIGYLSGDGEGLWSELYTPGKTLHITLPESADAAKARKFSLAVETDVKTEKAVEWQGGEVIEAVPGMSKLVPGLNVWDVAEVAPGKFKVGRASTPAQSAPLTLTAPNGRVAELAIDDDLVLEVKEK